MSRGKIFDPSTKVGRKKVPKVGQIAFAKMLAAEPFSIGGPSKGKKKDKAAQLFIRGGLATNGRRRISRKALKKEEDLRTNTSPPCEKGSMAASYRKEVRGEREGVALDSSAARRPPRGEGFCAPSERARWGKSSCANPGGGGGGGGRLSSLRAGAKDPVY